MCIRDSDYIDPKAHQISRQRWQPIVLTIRPAGFDHHVLAFDITRFFQTLMEALKLMPDRVG